jgi:hypothetical protein
MQPVEFSTCVSFAGRRMTRIDLLAIRKSEVKSISLILRGAASDNVGPDCHNGFGATV